MVPALAFCAALLLILGSLAIQAFAAWADYDAECRRIAAISNLASKLEPKAVQVDFAQPLQPRSKGQPRLGRN